MANDLWQWSACDLAAAIARKEVSCAEAMESVAKRIRERNGDLNAIVYEYTDEALAEARRAVRSWSPGGLEGPSMACPSR